MPTFDAVSGHGASIAMETDPSGAPYVFSLIGEIRGNVTYKHNLASTETTPHNGIVDTYTPDGRITRDAVTITVNYIYHNAATYHKLLKQFFHAKTYFRIRIRGPLGVANDDETIYWGFVESFQENNNERSGSREAVYVFRPTGAMTVDGVVYS